MIANVVMALAAVFILVTLHLQKQATQAAMFSDISGRISSILGENPLKKDKKADSYNWIVRLLNELEAIVFLGNNKLLSDKMMAYYDEFIIGWLNDIPLDYPEATDDFRKNQKDAYRELKKFYKSKVGKEAPIFSID